MSEKTARVVTGPIALELEGRYRIEGELGSGGLGTVYRAAHAKLGKPVAIKLLHEDCGSNEVLHKRFEREAKALARLEHPNIVAVTDYGLAGSTPYLVMELLEGETLAQRLEHGPPDPTQVCALGLALLRALAFVHANGLLHRDVKPGNIFLQRLPDGSECLKLLDFGLAKSMTLAVERADPTLTRNGEMLGTPAYMSPEQIGGGAIDTRTDVYAVGVLLFQMLTGRLPFEGSASDQLRGHLSVPAPRLSAARVDRLDNPALDAFLQRALAKAPEDRFADAKAMLTTLEALPRPWTLTASLTASLTLTAARANPSIPSAPRRSWFARAVRALFLATARLVTAAALLVIVIALVAIYWGQKREGRADTLERVRGQVAPRIVELKTTAERVVRSTIERAHGAELKPPTQPAQPEPPRDR